jgi:hypothetical protein
MHLGVKGDSGAQIQLTIQLPHLDTAVLCRNNIQSQDATYHTYADYFSHWQKCDDHNGDIYLDTVMPETRIKLNTTNLQLDVQQTWYCDNDDRSSQYVFSYPITLL